MSRFLRAALVIAALLLPLGLGSDAEAGAHFHLKLKAGPGGRFLVGHPGRVWHPVRVTVHLKHGGKLHSRILGLGKGGVLRVGRRARPLSLHVKGFGGSKLKVGPGGAKIHIKPKFKGRGGKGKGGMKLKF